MKRFTALLLAFLLTFGLFGCSQGENKPGPAVENDAVTQQADEGNLECSEENPSEEMQPKKLRKHLLQKSPANSC